MLDTLQLYWAYVRMYLKSRREYRSSFFMGMLANFYSYFFVYATFWVLTTRFNDLGGWKFSEVTVLYSLNLLTYALAGTLFWYTIYRVERLIVKGELDRFFLRPRGIVTQLVCHEFGYTFLGQIVVALIFMLTNLWHTTILFSTAKAVYLLAAVVGGVLIQSGGLILSGALSFWITRSEDVASSSFTA